MSWAVASIFTTANEWGGPCLPRVCESIRRRFASRSGDGCGDPVLDQIGHHRGVRRAVRAQAVDGCSSGELTQDPDPRPGTLGRRAQGQRMGEQAHRRGGIGNDVGSAALPPFQEEDARLIGWGSPPALSNPRPGRLVLGEGLRSPRPGWRQSSWRSAGRVISGGPAWPSTSPPDLLSASTSSAKREWPRLTSSAARVDLPPPRIATQATTPVGVGSRSRAAPRSRAGG